MKKSLFLTMFLTAGLLAAQAQEAQGSKPFPLEIVPKLHAYGAELDLGFKPFALIPGTETIFWLDGTARIDFPTYYRDPVTGDSLSSPTASQGGFSQWFFQWKTGIAQGLTWNSRIQKNLVEAFAYYRGTIFYNFSFPSGSYLDNSSLPDRSTLVQNAFLMGVSVNDLPGQNHHGLKSGTYWEASYETAPQALQTAGPGFSRINGIAQFFLPLLDLEPTKEENTFSILLGDQIVGDGLMGDHLPYSELQLVGGVIPQTGLASLVRGVEAGRFDAPIKFANNLDVRFNLPNLFGLPAVFPGLVAYFDAGAYKSLAGQSDGFLFSTGVGAFLELFNLGEVVISKHFWLNGQTLDGGLNIGIDLGLHF